MRSVFGGFRSASGQEGLPVSQGSNSTRTPPGVRSRNVECPNQVMDRFGIRRLYGCPFPDHSAAPQRALRLCALLAAQSTLFERHTGSRGEPDTLEAMAVEAPVQFIAQREPKPEWLKVRAPGSENYRPAQGIMQDLKLNTVCEDARCPNIGECWHHGTATFMILGDVCTRACSYCAVAHGRPNELDLAEPARVAEAVARMRLQYAVITSVDRDDQADGGAFVFAETIRLTRERVPDCRIEVLIPDFQGIESSLRTVLDAGPDVLNHNIETVPRLYRMARSGGKYRRSLELLDRSRTYRPDIATKTGIMVGLGEEQDEIAARLRRPASGRRLDPDHRPVSAALTEARDDGALLPSRRVLGAQAARAGARLRPRGIGPARALARTTRTNRQMRLTPRR